MKWTRSSTQVEQSLVTTWDGRSVLQRWARNVFVAVFQGWIRRVNVTWWYGKEMSEGCAFYVENRARVMKSISKTWFMGSTGMMWKLWIQDITLKSEAGRGLLVCETKWITVLLCVTFRWTETEIMKSYKKMFGNLNQIWKRNSFNDKSVPSWIWQEDE